MWLIILMASMKSAHAGDRGLIVGALRRSESSVGQLASRFPVRGLAWLMRLRDVAK
jgi:hypothetical protein